MPVAATVTLFDKQNPFVFSSGQTLNPVTVAYETYGEFTGENAICICHALTGDAHVTRGDSDKPGWWETMVGPGRAIDTDRFFVVSANLLGGCQGTTGPGSINPETGQPYALSFPLINMSDFVTVHRALGAHLGVTHWHAVVGGSLGGMQALQWSLDYPEEVENAVIIAASSRLTAQNIAFSAVARQAIMSDALFDDGNFASNGHNPDTGLAIARMMAHITYLSEEAFAKKFGRRPQADESDPGFTTDFAVESYLLHQGESFLNRFDALSYLYLSRVMDYFDPFSTNAAADLVKNPVNYLIISFDSDWRFSTEHSLRIVRKLAETKTPVTFREIQSPWGHDSFLLEAEPYLDTVRAFLNAEPTKR